MERSRLITARTTEEEIKLFPDEMEWDSCSETDDETVSMSGQENTECKQQSKPRSKGATHTNWSVDDRIASAVGQWLGNAETRKRTSKNAFAKECGLPATTFKH